MNSRTPNPLTGAGYQPDGEGAQQDHVTDGGQAPQNDQPTDNKEPEQAPKDGADGKDSEQSTGNPLTALVQNRQQARETADQYQAQIAALQQEVANLKAQGAEPKDDGPWKNPYDATEQPVDHLRAELEHTQAQVKQLEQAGTERLTNAENAQALSQFENSVALEIQRDAQNTPELLAAYGYIHNQVTQMHQGQGLSGQRLSEAVRNSMLQAFVNGQTHGNTHSQTVAQMALNMGFTAQKARAADNPDPVKRGQIAADQSIGQATGTGGDTVPPSARQLASMSKEDLTANNRAGINRIREILQGKVPIE